MDNQTASPNVFVNQVEQQVQQAAAGGAKKWFSPKLIFIILGIIIAVELIFGLKSIFGQPAAGGASTESAAKAKIVLSAQGSEFKVGDTISVKIDITSPTPSGGVDLLAKFDPTMLTASDLDIQKGEIFSQYPLIKIDPTGEIRISGVIGVGKEGFAGSGTFATINFRVTKAGMAKIMVAHSLGSTIDSNITDLTSAKDILEEVGNLEIIIK